MIFYVKSNDLKGFSDEKYKKTIEKYKKKK